MPPEAASACADRGIVAVTGATGFIGRHLVRMLASAGWQVRILARRDPAGLDWAGLQIDVVTGDLRDDRALRQLVTGATAIVHLAGVIKAPDEATFMAVNRDATRALADAAHTYATHASFFCISSLAAREPTLSFYARSKRAGEDEVRQRLGERADILRPAAVYGPGDRETLVFFQLAQRARIPLLGPPQARLSVVHVEDLCAAITAALEDGPTGAVRTICDGRPQGYSWRDVMQAAAAAIGRPNAPAFRLPRSALQLLARIGDLAHRFGNDNMLSSEKLRELLHEDWTISADEQFQLSSWSPKFSLEAGFADAAGWYRKSGWIA